MFVLGAKMEKERLGYVNENRKIARKKKKELEDKQIEQKVVSDKIESFENELRELETKLFKLQEIEKEYGLAAARVSATEGTLAAIQKQMLEIKLQIKEELNEDISSLKETISTFEDEKETKISELQKVRTSPLL
jgi:chromosome segregation ATPase